MISTKGVILIDSKYILSRISEEEIFKRYIPTFVEVNRKFCSYIRKDNNPSCVIFQGNLGLHYKDFGNGDLFNCFTYVMYIFNCNFKESLSIIANDFNLQYYTNIKPELLVPNHDIIKTKSSIIPIKKSWSIVDKNYWGQYNISLKTLDLFQVYPCERVFIEENSIKYTINNPLFCYDFDTCYKIYRPYADINNKWRGNTHKDNIEGYKQLLNGDTLIITKSLKDVMLLFEMGYPAISFSSEVVIPLEKSISSLKETYKDIRLLYDSDKTGIERSTLISELYGIPNLSLNEKSKDLSDYVQVNGFNKGKKLIKNLLYGN